MRYICSAELFFGVRSHIGSVRISIMRISSEYYILQTSSTILNFYLGVDIKIPIVRYSIFVKLQTQFLKVIFTLTQNIRFIDQLW